MFFLGAFVADDFHVFFGHEFNAVFFGPVYAAFEDEGEEDAGDIQDGLEGVEIGRASCRERV